MLRAPTNGGSHAIMTWGSHAMMTCELCQVDSNYQYFHGIIKMIFESRTAEDDELGTISALDGSDLLFPH
jgi:hypothetical protein